MPEIVCPVLANSTARARVAIHKPVRPLRKSCAKVSRSRRVNRTTEFTLFMDTTV